MSRYQIIVQGDGSEDETLRGIRSLLKRLGRTYLLRCVTITPIDASACAKKMAGISAPTTVDNENSEPR